MAPWQLLSRSECPKYCSLNVLLLFMGHVVHALYAFPKQRCDKSSVPRSKRIACESGAYNKSKSMSCADKFDTSMGGFLVERIFNISSKATCYPATRGEGQLLRWPNPREQCPLEASRNSQVELTPTCFEAQRKLPSERAVTG